MMNIKLLCKAAKIDPGAVELTVAGVGLFAEDIAVTASVLFYIYTP